ncbi:Gpi1-domain-containing protein [Ramicandelaber brevisporus]|nr:Gpi1-domain-containing protein [Ramicandelaber brevisporus]
MLRARKWNHLSLHTAHYVSFHNSMWLVINDVILGLAIGAVLSAHSDHFAQTLESTTDHLTVESFNHLIVWLKGQPAGFKLNKELDEFLGDLFLWLIQLWTELALLSDLISLLTLHTYWFYIVAGRIYYWKLRVLRSLFILFRGKKFNVLRNRIDACDYDLDQLLLGTILFTLLAFLFPTVVIYYIPFAFARIAIIALHGLIKTVLALLNHFPLFAIVIRLKDARRFPGGIRIQLLGKNNNNNDTVANKNGPHVQHLRLESTPLEFGRVFFQYFKLWQTLSMQYFSIDLVRKVIVGQIVHPIPQMYYAILPTTADTGRPDVDDIWSLYAAAFQQQTSRSN